MWLEDGKSMARTKSEQLDRWTRHYQAIFGKAGTALQRLLLRGALLKPRAVAEALAADFTMEEMTRAMGKSKGGRAAGVDALPVEVYKLIREASVKAEMQPKFLVALLPMRTSLTV